VVIGRDEAEVADRLAQRRSRIQGLVSPDALDGELASYAPDLPAVGTPEQIVEKLRPLVTAGMTYPIVYFPEAAYDTSGIDLFEQEVVPALRG